MFFFLLVSRVIKSWECFCHVGADLRRVCDPLWVPAHIPTQQSVNWNILFIKSHILGILITFWKSDFPQPENLCSSLWALFKVKFRFPTKCKAGLLDKINFFKGRLDTFFSAAHTINHNFPIFSSIQATVVYGIPFLPSFPIFGLLIKDNKTKAKIRKVSPV